MDGWKPDTVHTQIFNWFWFWMQIINSRQFINALKKLLTPCSVFICSFILLLQVRPFVQPWDTQGKRMGKEGKDGEGCPAHWLLRISDWDPFQIQPRRQSNAGMLSLALAGSEQWCGTYAQRRNFRKGFKAFCHLEKAECDLISFCFCLETNVPLPIFPRFN